jgi:ComF family protein
VLENGFSIDNLGFDNLLEFVFPSFCLVCDSAIDRPGELICSNCLAKAFGFPQAFCSNCRGIIADGFQSCPQCPPDSGITVLALGQYVDPLKEIIHKFKYHGFSKLGVELANQIVDKYLPVLEKAAIEGVIPIPLDPYREKARGFNQAGVLSDIIRKRLNLSPADGILAKIRRTKDQTKLDTLQREANMAGCFRVVDERLKDKKILVVDDVFTTGATLREAIRTLKESGIEPVLAAVVAAA